MELYNGYPLVYLNVDEELDSRFKMEALALVDQPATEMDWFTFSATPTYEFAAVNKEQRMITAPVMLANTPIERYDKKVGKYYTAFTPESILRMMKKYFVEGKQNNINEMHNGARVVDGVYMVESFIAGERNTTNLFDVEPGSWIATLYVEDEKYWEENIMSGKFKGISLEGAFDTVMNPEQTFAVKNSSLDSANVDKIQYNSKARRLVVRFHEGATYTYDRVSPATAEQILRGQAECITSGESAWGSWKVGKTPSLGAAIHKFLVKQNHPFTRGGQFFSKEDAAVYLIEEIAKSPLRDEDMYDLIKGITDQV